MQQSNSAENPQPNPMIIGWIAGFIDGEGSFGVNIQQRKDRGFLQAAPRIIITQSCEATAVYISEQLAAMGAGNCIKKKKNYYGPSARQQYSINIIGYKRVGNFFNAVPSASFITKRPQAILLEGFVRYRLSIYQYEAGGKRTGYNGNEIIVADLLKKLNQREGSTTVMVESLSILEIMGQSGLHGDMERWAEMTYPIWKTR